MDQVASADNIGRTMRLVLNSLLSLAGVEVPDASAERGVEYLWDDVNVDRDVPPGLA